MIFNGNVISKADENGNYTFILHCAKQFQIFAECPNQQESLQIVRFVNILAFFFKLQCKLWVKSLNDRDQISRNKKYFIVSILKVAMIMCSLFSLMVQKMCHVSQVSFFMAKTLVNGSFLSFVKCQAFDMAFIL